MRAKLDKLTGNLRESDLPSGVDLPAMQQQAHRHDNKSVLDKFSESDGKLLFDGAAMQQPVHQHDNKSVLDKISEADGKLLFDGAAVTEAAEVATQTANGLMSKEDKAKLDGLGGVATQTANGLMSKEDKAKLDGLGGVATQSANGLMSKEDKTKLDVLVQAQIGSIALFAGADLPEGYLLCDGAALNREVYAELFSAIGTAWGEGDGSTTFNLPDLTDKTVWGGEAEAVGGYREAGLPNITGELFQDGVDADTNNGLVWGGSGAFYVGGQQDNNSASYTPSSTPRRPKKMGFDASRSSSIYGHATSVQPPAAVLQFCIKYM